MRIFKKLCFAYQMEVRLKTRCCGEHLDRTWKLHEEELHKWDCSRYSLRMIQPRRMSWSRS